MEIRGQFVQVLQQQAGVDGPTAERVADVAIRFASDHAPELIQQYGPEPFKSMGSQTGSGGIGGMLGGQTRRQE